MIYRDTSADAGICSKTRSDRIMGQAASSEGIPTRGLSIPSTYAVWPAVLLQHLCF